MRIAAHVLAGDLHLCLAYVPSEDNPGDPPSRGIMRTWRRQRQAQPCRGKAPGGTNTMHAQLSLAPRKRFLKQKALRPHEISELHRFDKIRASGVRARAVIRKLVKEGKAVASDSDY